MNYLSWFLSAWVWLAGAIPAAYGQTQAADSVPETIVVLGKGLRNQHTGEIVLLACVTPFSSGTCPGLRLIEIYPHEPPRWLGRPFSNAFDLREKLRQWYQAAWLSGPLQFKQGGSFVYSFTNQEGWNWSSSPVSAPDDRFKQAISSILYFAEQDRGSQVPDSNPQPERRHPLDQEGTPMISADMTTSGFFARSDKACLRQVRQGSQSRLQQLDQQYRQLGGRPEDLTFEAAAVAVSGDRIPTSMRFVCYIRMKTSDPRFQIRMYRRIPWNHATPGGAEDPGMIYYGRPYTSFSSGDRSPDDVLYRWVRL